MAGFDGQNYGSGAFVFPSAYHPGAGLNGTGLSTTLANLHYLAGAQSQVVFQQAYGWNGQHPEINSGYAGLSILAGTHTQIAHGYARIPARARYLQGVCTFAGMPLGDAVAQHQLVIVGAGTGGSDIQGELVATPVPAATSYDSPLGYAQGLLAPNWIPTYAPAGVVDPAIHVAWFDVPIADATILDDDLEFYAQGCIVGDVATAYKPFFVSIWWGI